MHEVTLVLDMAERAGAEQHVLDLARSLATGGRRVSVLCFQAGPLLAALTAAGLPCACLAAGHRLSPLGFLRLVAYLREHRPDVVHLHQPQALLYGALAARLASNSRVVATVHSSPRGFTFRARSSWQRWTIFHAHRSLAWLSFVLADRVIAVSQSLASELSAWPGSARKLALVHNGLDAHQFQPGPTGALRQALGGWEGELLLSVGTLNPLKGYPEMCEAFIQLAAEFPRLGWAIVGKTEDRGVQSSLEARLSAVGLASRVKLLGARDDLQDLFADADVFVTASHEETFGRAVLEAMACGVPVVATRVGGLKEVVEDGVSGVLVEPGNPRALVTALKALLGDPAGRRSMGQAGVLRARAAFGQARMVSAIEQVYGWEASA